MRAFKAVGGSPHFIASAAGARITDVDGNSYIDYVGSMGADDPRSCATGLTQRSSRARRGSAELRAAGPLEVGLAE